MVLDFEAALALLSQQAAQRTAGEAMEVPLLEAAGLVLAEPVLADRDQPPFARATRDGFAVRAADVAAGLALRVIGQVRAGESWTGAALGESEAFSIMTGAPLPAGADAVVMVEHVERGEGTVRVVPGRMPAVGENVVPRGSEAQSGATVLQAGTRIGGAEIALAAACGRPRLRVFRRPRVAIVSTGDELVELNEPLGADQIRNSNSYALAALVTAAGGHAERLAIAHDLRDEVRERIAEGRMADLLILSGGVSMGEYDLVEEVLAEFGAEFLFTGVKMQPGKPVVFGRLPECFFFGLPGNPISTQVTFHCFVEPLLRTLGGERAAQPRWAQATLSEGVQAKAGLTRLLPARRDGVDVRAVGWQGSGDLAANARANCYVELLPGRGYSGGEVVRVLLR